MSKDKKTATAVERLREHELSNNSYIEVKDFSLVKDAIVELAKRMDEMEDPKLIAFRKDYAKLLNDFFDPPPAKPEPDAEWPEIVISQMATANFHSLSIRVKGEWPITIATFNSQYLKYFEAMAASYHERFGIIKLTSSEHIEAMLNLHGHDQEGGE